MKLDAVYKIKDSVDLFWSNQRYLTVYYMNTRQRKTFVINHEMIHFFECIDGKSKLSDICDKMGEEYHVPMEAIEPIVNSLIRNRIITEVKANTDILPSTILERYDRQINYFSEFFEDDESAVLAQKKLMESRVLIFGCGAVGGDIAIELAMAGVGFITLFDYDLAEPSDIARHLYYRTGTGPQPKVDLLARELKNINSEIQVNTVCEKLRPDSDIEELISQHDFVVNTLDEPYIGYTSTKISRICMKLRLPHYIAGGFDAHLSSTGELIIPYVTPCVECYANHFKQKLKNWKPDKHPVEKRYMEIGGLSCQSLFSASYACIEIIKYLAGLVVMNDNYKIRGEFLFHDMSLTYLDVKRDPACPICGGVNP